MPRVKRRWMGAAIAFVVAAVAVTAITIGPSGGRSSLYPHASEANRLCSRAKRRILTAKEQHRSAPVRLDYSRLANSILSIIADTRVRIVALPITPDWTRQVATLDLETLKFEDALTRLLHLDSVDRRRILATAAQVDAAASELKEAALSLGLAQCAELPLAISPSLR